MSKQLFSFVAILIAVITISWVSHTKKNYSEKEFIDIINKTEFFSYSELEELIENTEFETLSPQMIRKCDGSAADYCKGDFPSGVPRPKCCVSSTPPQF